MLDIPPTEQNKFLAKAVNSRIAADASFITAKALLWRMGAYSVLALAIGAGIGLAFLGYARSRDVSAHADTIAEAISKAMKDTTLTAKIDEHSSVRLDSKGSQVVIDPGSTIAVTGSVPLDTRGASVSLDPTARIRIEASGDVRRPTVTQMGSATGTYRGRTVNTNFTVFKNVRYNDGSVVTGYNYEGDEARPKSQFCYYSTDAVEGASVRVNLAIDNVYKQPKMPMRSFNATDAAQNCIWFDGTPTRF